MSDTLPPDVRELLQERHSARRARDWSRADALRDRLAQLGWQVQDTPSGSSARPILPRASTSSAPDDTAIPSRLSEPATVAASIQVVAEDHPDDLARFLRGWTAHPPPQPLELIVLANAPSFDVDPLLDEVAPATTPVLLRASHRLGWAESRTLGLRRSSGEVTVMVDTSIEPTGDFVTPLLAAFDDPRVGLAGPWGVTSETGRHFHDAPPGEVDAIESYCLAVRREALRAVDGFDPRFRFYRNADLDFSFAIRAAGWRAVSTQPLPLVRHEHRGYAALPDDERERLSRRNFYRFLKRWGDRRDLLVELHRH